jgi:hypothetical protein
MIPGTTFVAASPGIPRRNRRATLGDTAMTRQVGRASNFLIRWYTRGRVAVFFDFFERSGGDLYPASKRFLLIVLCI